MKNALLRLREASASLSAAEQQIARYITENPEEATLLTVRELAQRTFTSPSSVVRVCRSVGFDGYKELRRALVGELAALGDKGRHAEAELSPADSVRDIVDKVTHKNIQSLSDSQLLLSPDVVEQCVQLLDSCRCVLLFGLGSSLLVAHDTYLKFLRLDKPCMVTDDWHAQLLSARNATPDYLGIVFSYSGQTVRPDGGGDPVHGGAQGKRGAHHRHHPLFAVPGGGAGGLQPVYCGQRIPLPQRGDVQPDRPAERGRYPLHRLRQPPL